MGRCVPFYKLISKEDPTWYGPAQVSHLERGPTFLLYLGGVLAAPQRLAKVFNPESAPTQLLDMDADGLNLPIDFVKTAETAPETHNEVEPDLLPTDSNSSDAPAGPLNPQKSLVPFKSEPQKLTWEKLRIRAEETGPRNKKRVFRGKLLETLGGGSKKK